MSRSFASASSQLLESSTVLAPTSASVFTVAGWFTLATLGTIRTLWSECVDAGANNYFELGTSATDTTRFRARTTAASDANGTTAVSAANTWNHICGVSASATSRSVYLNGANKITNTTSRVPSGMNRTTLGAKLTSTLPQYHNGLLAEWAKWDAALTDTEIALLANGISPLFVRPDKILEYWPLYGRHSPEIELRSRVDLTLTGAPTTGDHCRIFSPSSTKRFGKIAPLSDRLRYVNTASTAGGDGTTNATTGANRAYAGLNAALSSEVANLISANVVLKILCEGTDATVVSVPATYTTDATRYIWIDGQNLYTHASNAYDPNFTISAKNVTVERMIVSRNGASTKTQTFRVLAGNVKLNKITSSLGATITRDSGFAMLEVSGVASGESFLLRNSVLYNALQKGLYLTIDSGATYTIENCTIDGSETDNLFLEANSSSGTVVNLKNNLLTNKGSGSDYVVSAGSATLNTATNGTSDATSPQTGLRSLTIVYTNAAAGDFTVVSGGSINAGTDLSANGYTDDRAGNSRSAPWDVGAYESVSGSAAGASAGAATVSGVGASAVLSAAASSGVATVSGVGAAAVSSTGSASGVATSTATGASLTAVTGTSAGAASVSGAGRADSSAAGICAGVATATATGSASATTAGNSAGIASVAAAGAAVISSVGSAAGVATSTAAGAASTAAAGNSAGAASVTGAGAAAVSSIGSSAGVASSAVTGASLTAVTGTSAGAASVSGAGRADSSAAGISAGISTVAGAGDSSTTSGAAGTSAGIATVAGAGAAAVSSAGTSAGIATIGGSGSAVAASAGSSAGAATVAGAGDSESTAGSAGTSAGIATVAGVGSAVTRSTGSSAGAGIASGTGAAHIPAAGAASGVATVAGVGSAVTRSTGTSAGVATVAGAGDYTGDTGATGTSAGISTAAATGASITRSTGTSAGAGTTAGTGAAVALAIGSSTSSSTAAAYSGTNNQAIGTSAGTSTALAAGQAIAAAAGNAAGVATVSGYTEYVVLERIIELQGHVGSYAGELLATVSTSPQLAGSTRALTLSGNTGLVVLSGKRVNSISLQGGI